MVLRCQKELLKLRSISLKMTYLVNLLYLEIAQELQKISMTEFFILPLFYHYGNNCY